MIIQNSVLYLIGFKGGNYHKTIFLISLQKNKNQLIEGNQAYVERGGEIWPICPSE